MLYILSVINHIPTLLVVKSVVVIPYVWSSDLHVKPISNSSCSEVDMADVLRAYRKASAAHWLRHYIRVNTRHVINHNAVITSGTSQRPKVNRTKTTQNVEHVEREVLADGTVWNIVHQSYTLPRPARTKDTIRSKDTSATKLSASTRPASRAPQPTVECSSPQDLASTGFVVYQIRSSDRPVARCSSLSDGSVVSSNKSNDNFVVYRNPNSTSAGDRANTGGDDVAPHSDQIQTNSWVCQSSRISYTDEKVSVIQLG